ncbi:Arginyl-tRNA--protein transferase [hydrothermal vent metagenome]|uniref:Arginyl-tRNA--protein transferase n=1 Tax=hydrothermal vent metagenome TaxID=652676 RepID=A0A3B0UZ80_9ZZZZ
MSLSPPEATQFYLTAPSPCPYLADREERKMFTHLLGRRSQGLHQLLADNGFRRSQNLIYRPSCENCCACMSARVCVDKFVAGKRHRRIIRANQDLEVLVVDPHASDEQFEIFSRYLNARHNGGGMTQMSEDDYQDMIEDTAVSTSVVEYRLTSHDENSGKLVAVSLSDNMVDGYSMVYSFFDPDLKTRSLGNFMVLDHIARARQASLDFVYLGYLVEGSPKMNYKSQFAPLQVQSFDYGWVDYELSDHSAIKPE